MSNTSTQAPSDEQLSGFFEKLLDFRDTLPENEKVLVDQVVQSATGGGASETEVADNPEITQDEVESFTRKLEDLRSNMSEDDRKLLDGLAVEAGVAQVPEEDPEDDVSGHMWLLWTRTNYGRYYTYYKNACFNRYGTQTFRSRYLYTNYYGNVYRYRCFQN